VGVGAGWRSVTPATDGIMGGVMVRADGSGWGGPRRLRRAHGREGEREKGARWLKLRAGRGGGLVNSNEFKKSNLVQTWFAPKVTFQVSIFLNKITIDRFRQEEQLLLLQYSHIGIQI
jgi:hypothetical protein